MEPNELEQLLKNADAGATLRASDPAALADRVLKTIRRRRVTRTVTALLMLAGLMGLTLLNLPTSAPKIEIAIAPQPRPDPRVDEELAAIRMEIEARESTVRQLLIVEERLSSQRQLAVRASRPDVQSPTERASAAVVFEADRMVRLAGLTEPALKAYNEVISLFPTSISAEIARQRVAEIKKEG